MNITETRCSFIHWQRFYFSRYLLTTFQHFNSRFATIIKIECNRLRRDIHHGNITYPDILNNSSAPTLALKTQTDIRPQELTIADRDIAYTTTHFTTNHKTTVAFEYCTTIYHHILTNTSPAATVFVFATLQTNTIIAHIKCRVHNQCILARFQIQTITILRITRITNLYFFYQHILTHPRMQVPCR